MQSIVRGMLGRKRAAHAAKRVFKKYLTEDRSAVYYYNTATKAKQWHKPYLLHGNNDVEEIPMPTNDEKYLVYCEQCEGDSPNMAVKYCNNCQSAMCEEHDKLTHRRGRRARHIRTDLEVCRVCDYQNASRKCKHCHDARFQCDTVRLRVGVPGSGVARADNRHLCVAPTPVLQLSSRPLSEAGAS